MTALVTVLIALLLLGVIFVLPGCTLRLLAKSNPDLLFFVETTRKRVALTIDDSPDAEVTPLILDALRAHNARATFFVLGDRIDGNESLLRRIVEEGHELGNHHLHDEPSIRLDADRFRDGLLRVDRRLRRFGPPRWFRPGSG